MNIGTMIIFFLGMKNINLVIICQYLFRFSHPAVYNRIYNGFPKEKKLDCKLYPCTNMCIFDNDIMCKTSSLYLCLFRSIHKSKDELQITFIWQYVYTYSIYLLNRWKSHFKDYILHKTPTNRFMNFVGSIFRENWYGYEWIEWTGLGED